MLTHQLSLPVSNGRAAIQQSPPSNNSQLQCSNRNAHPLLMRQTSVPLPQSAVGARSGLESKAALMGECKRVIVRNAEEKPSRQTTRIGYATCGTNGHPSNGATATRAYRLGSR